MRVSLCCCKCHWSQTEEEFFCSNGGFGTLMKMVLIRLSFRYVSSNVSPLSQKKKNK